MRILQACPYAWDKPGGVQTHVRALGRELTRRGHEVLTVAPAFADEGDPRVLVAGSPVRVPYNGSVASICPNPLAARRVRRALSAFQPDVVHVHDPFVPSTSMFAAWFARVPIVATFHTNATRSRLFTALAPVLKAVIWRRIDVPLAVSAAAAEYVGGRLGVELAVIPNGVDVSPAMAALARPDGRTLLFLSRLDPRKGFPVLVRAFAELADRMPDLRLVVIGDGRDRTAVDRLPDPLGRRVTMLGRLADGELAAHLAAADVFVAPAVGGESFGIILLEAMAAGLPVVASDIPGYRAIVRHEREGLLVPPGDAAGLAAAIARVLADAPLADRLRAAGRLRAGQFSWPAIAALLDGVYAAAPAMRAWRHTRPVDPAARPLIDVSAETLRSS